VSARAAARKGQQGGHRRTGQKSSVPFH
jgi:hypothetical protein